MIKDNNVKVTQNCPFDTEISQDAILQDKNNHQFTPWVRKKTHNTKMNNDTKNTNHSFLAKIKISSNIPKEQEDQATARYIKWLKKDLKSKIEQQGISNLSAQEKNLKSPKFVEHRNNFSRKSKNLKIYHKPKPIQLSLDFSQLQKNRQTILSSTFSPNDRFGKGKRQNNFINRRDKKLSLLQNYQANRDNNIHNILENKNKFYQTLQLKLNKGENFLPQRIQDRKFSMTASKNKKSGSNSFDRKFQDRSNLETRNSDYRQQILKCQGKNLLTSEYHSRKERIRILCEKKQFHQTIFLV